MREISYITDYFVIASGDNPRQIKGAAQSLLEELRGQGERPLGTEGMDSGDWVLLDFNDVIVHLLDRKLRDFYDMEMLWGDAPRVEWQPLPPPHRSEE